MNECIRLTAEELYFLGKKMNAEYIDYIYITAITGLKDFFNDTIDVEQSLTSKGYIEADFSGEIEIDSNVVTLLTPVFFGNKEAIVDYFNAEDDDDIISYRFHINGENCTEILMEEDELIVRACEKTGMSDAIKRVVMLAKNVKKNTETSNEVSAIISVKYAQIGEKEAVQTFFVKDGKISTESRDGILGEISQDTYEKAAGMVLESGDAYGTI